MLSRKAFVHFAHSCTPCLALTALLAGCNDATTAWVPAGTFLEPRRGHSAALLPNNAVLFAGGIHGNTPLSTTEVRSTATNLWSLGAPMQQARADHAAASLADGRVLVFGGKSDTAGALSSVEVYDPGTNQWSFGTSLPAARAQHTATNLDTTILVVGGSNATGEVLATAALYDVAGDKWLDAGSLTTPRRDHTATRLADGSILVLGGSGHDGQTLASAEKYQCTTNVDTSNVTCSSMPLDASLHVARHGHTATLLTDGNVLVVGGEDADAALDSVEMFDMAQNKFVEMEPLSSPRTQHSATWLADSSVLVVGGNASTDLASAERFVPEDPRIPCQRTTDCPQAMVCNAEQRCEQTAWPLSSESACAYAARPVPARGIPFFLLGTTALALWQRRKRLSKRAGAAFVVGSLVLCPNEAEAQVSTFYLDRLQIGGGPEDGTAVWRPRFGRTQLFGQLALGYARDSLRVSSFVHDTNQARALFGSAVNLQITGYATAGIEFAQRGAIQVSLPYVVHQRGYATDNRAVGLSQPVDLASSTFGDMRIDGRMLVAWNESQSFRLAARGAVFLPTGDEFSFTGERSAWGNLGLSAEYDAEAFFVTANAGWTVRPKSTLVDLTVGTEFVYALGLYVPLKHDRVRAGAELFGAVGLSGISPETIPLEGAFAARLALGTEQRVFLGVSAGGRLGFGYAPELRFVARIGGALPFTEARPEPSLPVRLKPPADTDRDGFLDVDDKCPAALEDNKREKDGCPEMDEDKDGIDTSLDQCPLEAEDKDGLDDEDGCPEEDADEDGFADIDDKCPKDPGVRNANPEKLGCPRYIERTMTEVVFNKKIEFETASATITVTSYSILDEIAKVLLANPQIKQMRIEGHTDNAGDPNFNRQLSKRRAEAVRTYLVQQGKVEEGRLSAVGFGPAKPIAPNDTEEGRAKNRRVELHYGEDDEGGKEKKP